MSRYNVPAAIATITPIREPSRSSTPEVKALPSMLIMFCDGAS